MNNKKIRLLLIQDDQIDQLAFERLVDRQGLPYKYKIANSVAQAQQMIDPANYDIFIADYNLGDGTVFDIIDLMKENPTIITTGAGGEEIAVKAMREGVFDYLIKDVEHNYLKVLPIIMENAIKHKKKDDQIKMLSHAMMNISDSVFIADMSGKIIFVNRSFCETYGYSEKEILKKSSELFQNDPVEIKPKSDHVIYKDFAEYYHFRKDGSEFTVSLTQSKIIDDRDKEIATVWVIRYITESKRADEGLK